jgi:hypothetical protein
VTLLPPIAILNPMRSVADELREEQLRELLARSPGERIELARNLGEEGLRFSVATQGITREEAIRRIRHQRRAGRVRSGCMDEE